MQARFAGCLFLLQLERTINMIDLKQGDCLELMKEIPDKSVDAIVTDPPSYRWCRFGKVVRP